MGDVTAERFGRSHEEEKVLVSGVGGFEAKKGRRSPLGEKELSQKVSESEGVSYGIRRRRPGYYC